VKQCYIAPTVLAVTDILYRQGKENGKGKGKEMVKIVEK